MIIHQWFFALLILLGIVLVLTFTELSYRRLELPTEVTRKFAHFTACISTIVLPYVFTSHWYVFGLAVFFFLILFLSSKGVQLQSIHKIDRKSVGGFLLPPAVYVTFLISSYMDNKFMYVLPMLIVGISDPMAGMLGMNIKQNNKYIKIFGHTLQKTAFGSLAFLVSSFLIALIGLYIYMGVFQWRTLWLAMLISVVTTITEMLSKRGWDNLLIPIATNIILILFLP